MQTPRNGVGRSDDIVKIAVDARELRGRRTGVGRYLHEVLRSLAQSSRAAAHEFVLCSPGPLDVSAYMPLHISTLVSPGRACGGSS